MEQVMKHYGNAILAVIVKKMEKEIESGKDE